MMMMGTKDKVKTRDYSNEGKVVEYERLRMHAYPSLFQLDHSATSLLLI
jgi:hypothetical protein